MSPYIPAMKWVVSLWLMTLAFAAAAQKNAPLATEDIDPAALAAKITADYTTDKAKVQAIFAWIANNIDYNVRAAARNRKSGVLFEEIDDTSRILKPLNYRVSEIVLRKRTAVCDGYSRLFKTLCDFAGVRSEIIMGYARTGSKGASKFRSNHTWNAVKIDSTWHLLDVTWATGFITYRGDEFVRSYDSRYFLTAPEQFIMDHYPEDIRWTLLKSAPTLDEFRNGPFRYTGFLKNGITSYTPAKGIIEADPGDVIKFEIESERSDNFLLVDAVPYIDTSEFDVPSPGIMTKGKKAVFTYTVTDPAAEWLYVTCNGQIILRYKLVVRKPGDKIALHLQE
jgi:transglutaminase/protease-like cytokinesis protein 3